MLKIRLCLTTGNPSRQKKKKEAMAMMRKASIRGKKKTSNQRMRDAFQLEKENFEKERNAFNNLLPPTLNNTLCPERNELRWIRGRRRRRGQSSLKRKQTSRGWGSQTWWCRGKMHQWKNKYHWQLWDDSKRPLLPGLSTCQTIHLSASLNFEPVWINKATVAAARSINIKDG